MSKETIRPSLDLYPEEEKNIMRLMEITGAHSKAATVRSAIRYHLAEESQRLIKLEHAFKAFDENINQYTEHRSPL